MSTNSSCLRGRRGRAWCLLALAPAFPLVVMSGCDRAVAKPPPPKPPVVMTSEPVSREVTDFEDFVGQTTAKKTVEIRARVNGYLDKVNFTDGDEVKEGAVLFEIDPRPTDAEVARTEAAVVQSEAHAKRLEANYKRAVGLRGREVLSAQEFDLISGDYAEANAAVGISKANNDLAKLNRGFTKVTAPIAGRLSRRMVDSGNLVQADQTLLTTIVTLDPIYVYFDIDERTLLRIRRLIAAGKIKSRTEAAITVYAALSDEEGFPHEGTINFSENRVDPNTGTLRVRAEIPNPVPRVLSPGMFMRVRLPVGTPHRSLLVPEQALGTDQGRKFLYVVKPGKDKDGKPAQLVEYRPVVVGSMHDGLRVVDKGLAPGEQIIVSGLQRVRPGISVEPRPMAEAKPTTSVAGEVKPPGPTMPPTRG